VPLSRSHWHKERPNVCTEVTLQTASLADRHITSDCGGQHWTISGTNLMLCQAEKKMHITEKQYTTDHKTKHIQYTAFPAMPMVAQLIKIFHTIFWKVRFITKFIRMSLKALLKHELSKSILIQFLKIHFNITLLYSHRPSEWTLSSPFSNQ